MTATPKEKLLYQIDDMLRSKTTGEYHSHTFAATLYITEKTYRKALKKKTIEFYLPIPSRTSHEIVQLYISNNGVSISTYTYYMPVSELSWQELEAVYNLMQKECSIISS